MLILSVCCYSTVIEEHHHVMNDLFKGKTNEHMAKVLLGLLENPAVLIFFMFTYLIGLGFGLGVRFITRIVNLHDIVIDMFNRVVDYLSYYMTKLFGYPFNVVLNLVRRFAEWAGLQISSLLDLIQEAGNILINTWVLSKQQAIEAWFGDGNANTDSYNKLIIMLILYVLLLVSIIWVAWKIGWKVYLHPYTQHVKETLKQFHKENNQDENEKTKKKTKKKRMDSMDSD